MCDNENDNVICIDDGSKRIDFEIDEIIYSSVVSIGQLLIPTVDVTEDFDYRKYVCSVLVDCTDSKTKPSFEQIVSQSDSFFIQIFNCFLTDDEKFYAIYDEIQCDEICKHYSIAYCKYCMRNLPSATKDIKENLGTALSNISQMAYNVLQNVDLSFLDSLTEKINKAMSWYAENADTIISGMKAALDSFGRISETILSGISETLQYIHIPEISEERKKELLKSYENWGKYGWTVPPFADIGCFNDCPATLLEADKIALQYCGKSDMQMLFSVLEDACARKKDIREAIYCYNAHQYKACALILFSVIDSRLIRLQSKNTEKYSVGTGAIAKYKKIVEQQTTDSGKLFLSLHYANLFPCLFSVFADTENFSKKTTVINRNYLDHGMSYKTVRKKDCIKLFLLLYNLLEFIEIVK